MGVHVQGLSGGQRGGEVYRTARLHEPTRESKQVFAELVAAVAPNVVVEIMGCKNPYEAWKALKQRFATESIAHVIAIGQRIKSKQFCGQNLSGYLEDMRRLHEDLKAAGGHMEDDEFIRTLLCGVVADHMRVIVTVFANKADVSIAELFSALLLEDERHNTLHKKSSTAEGLLFAKDRVNVQSEENGTGGHVAWKEKRKCFRCHQTGHLSAKCPLRKTESSEQALTANHSSDEWLLVAKSTNECVEQSANAGAVPTTSCTVPVQLVTMVDRAEKAFRARSDVDNKLDQFIWADSGATKHMFPDKNRLQNYKELNFPVEISLGDDRTITAIGMGSLEIVALDGSRIALKNVLHVPHVVTGLFSISAACDDGASLIQFNEQYCSMRLGSRTINIGARVGRLYKIMLPMQHSAMIAATQDVWHSRRGHLGYDVLTQDIVNKTVIGMELIGGTPESCVHCVRGKAARTPMPKFATRRANGVNDLIHSDLMGPMSVLSPGGKRFVLTFIDDFSRFVNVYFLSSKSEVFGFFKQFKALVENEHGRNIKCLRTDNGGEYMDGDFQDFMAENGIRHERSSPRRQAQNGVSERMNRTLMDMARTMLFQANLAKKWWAEAVSTAAYLRNRANTKALTRNSTPFEQVYGIKPDVSNLRVFGCFVMYKDDKAKKLDVRAREGVMLGYSLTSKAYRILDRYSQKIIVTRDVKFWEEREGMEENHVQPESDEEVVDDELDDEHDDANEIQPLRRSARRSVAPLRFVQEAAYVAQSTSDPKNRREALSSGQAAEWESAMADELKTLQKNETWEVVQRPDNRTVIDGRWVFKLKHDAEGKPVRYKARYVARGFSQVPGVDYTDTYAPVASTDSQRILLAKAAADDLEAFQLDIETSFQHQTVREELFIELPEGMKLPDGTSRATHCGRLRKALYGLKQAAYELNSRLKLILLRAEYKFSNADPCVFYRHDENDLLIASVHIDDMLIVCSCVGWYQELKEVLGLHFPIKDLGEIGFLLGCKITRDRTTRTIKFSQGAYARDVLRRFQMENAQQVSTPSSTSVKLQKSKEGDPSVAFPYREAVGSLMYLSIMTRPDIAEAVNTVARFVERPGQQHVVAVKRILRYVKGTVDLGIVFGREHGLKVYSDADWAGDQDDRRSTSGMLITLHGGPVSYFSRKQKCVALSSTEAEYIAASEACKVVAWVRNFLHEFPGELISGPVIVYEDNQGCIAMTDASVSSKRTKHIDIRYHFVRDMVRAGLVKFEYLGTKQMLADMFTKPVPREQHEFHRAAMNVLLG